MNIAALPDHESPASAAPEANSNADAHRAIGVKMRAVVATGCGAPEVLKLTEVTTPKPTDNELLIRVHATNVTAADSMMRRGDPFYGRLFLGLRKPKAAIPGTGLAGVVEAVGADVTAFSVGDEVFGEAGLKFGAHAQYVCVPADGVILPKPASLSFEDAAALCDGPLTSFNFLHRMADVQPGQKVLVNGASGALGTAAIQIASSLGAEVTGVCSAANSELVKSLGADRVIDYNAEDFTLNRGRYDVIYDTVGKSSYGRAKKALSKNGTFLSPVLSFRLLLQMLWTTVFSKKSAKFDATGMRPAAELRVFLTEVITLTQTGKLRSVLDRSYRLDQILEAHAHVDGGHKKGTIILRMQDTGTA